MSIVSEVNNLIDVSKIIIRTHKKVYEDMICKEYGEIKFSPSDVNGRAVIDIGAHIGMFSLLCQVCGAKSITSIEANPKTFQLMKENLAKCTAVTSIINKAVVDGCVKSINLTDSDTESMITNKSSAFNVQCLSLDEILKVQTDDAVLKMDIEGAEYSVLPACSKISLRKCKTIFLETHGGAAGFAGSDSDSNSP